VCLMTATGHRDRRWSTDGSPQERALFRAEFTIATMHPQLILVEKSVLHVCKFSMREAAGMASHYWLSEKRDFNNSLGWGPSGLEVRGTVRVTAKEVERMERFLSVARYNIAANNCEHFANYVLHGLNLSSQVDPWWKKLSADVVALLQPTQGKGENVSDYVGRQVSGILEESLRRVRTERANRERIDFWKARGIDLT